MMMHCWVLFEPWFLLYCSHQAKKLGCKCCFCLTFVPHVVQPISIDNSRSIQNSHVSRDDPNTSRQKNWKQKKKSDEKNNNNNYLSRNKERKLPQISREMFFHPFLIALLAKLYEMLSFETTDVTKCFCLKYHTVLLRIRESQMTWIISNIIWHSVFSLKFA